MKLKLERCDREFVVEQIFTALTANDNDIAWRAMTRARRLLQLARAIEAQCEGNGAFKEGGAA